MWCCMYNKAAFIFNTKLYFASEIKLLFVVKTELKGLFALESQLNM